MLRWSLALLFAAGVAWGQMDRPPELRPRTPGDELATFRVRPGFRVELVAAEPAVVDPVAFAFDERGRLFVVEMPGYPNGGLGDGPPTEPGRIKLLEDRNGDGIFETAKVFTTGLRFPTGLTPWRGGLFVADAPRIIYCPDADDDGVADRQEVWFEGFGTHNIQQLPNSLQFHLDNHLHGCNGRNESHIRAAARPDEPPVPLRGRHFRFDPRRPGHFDPTTGGGQYGLAFDAWGNGFTCTNSEHLRQLVLPDHYLRRQPALPALAAVVDIPDHGAAAKVQRISPFEGWRVERTQRRRQGADAQRFPSTELVPGGYMTSASGLTVYLGDQFPAEYHGNVFVCDPANNLIHRDVLVGAGPVFTAKRGDHDCEFFASTDNWCRPVFLANGPDGALYFADFYREVIETPLSLPDDIKARANLGSAGKGRIWRIVAESAPARQKPTDLHGLAKRDLVPLLGDNNGWHRLTAQRLLIERGAVDSATLEVLQQLAREGSPVARSHAGWTLVGLGQLSDAVVLAALKAETPQLREQGLKWAEARLASPTVRAAVLGCVNDAAERVRWQLAFTLGEWRGEPAAAEAWRTLAQRDGGSPWHRQALLSAVGPHVGAWVPDCVTDPALDHELRLNLVRIVAATGSPDRVREMARILHAPAAENLSFLFRFRDGLAYRGETLDWLVKPSWLKPEAMDQWFNVAHAAIQDDRQPLAQRRQAVDLLAAGEWSRVREKLRGLLAPTQPPAVRRQVILGLARRAEPEATEWLIDQLTTGTPSLRHDAGQALLQRADRVRAVLAAVEGKRLAANALDPTQLAALRKHPDADVRHAAVQLEALQSRRDRQTIVTAYRPAVELPGRSDQGRAVFRKHCVACHRLENIGDQVGADLLAALPNKTKEQLLLDILDPNREIDPRFMNYIVVTKQGLTHTGIVVADLPARVTLQRAEKMETDIPRVQIDEMQTTGLSLMPEGFEKDLTPQDLADLMAYLLGMVRK